MNKVFEKEKGEEHDYTTCSVFSGTGISAVQDSDICPIPVQSIISIVSSSCAWKTAVPVVITFHENIGPIDFVQCVLYKSLPDHCLKEVDVVTSNFCVDMTLCVKCTAKV